MSGNSHMFRGIHAVNVDSKGRMAIPARYRSRLLEESCQRFVVTIDTEEQCLLVYPFVVWEQIEKKINDLPSFNATTRRIQRLLVGHAVEADMDSHGRILISSLLREYAGIDKRVVLIGQGQKFELWDEEQWQARRSAWLDEKSDVAGDLPQSLSDLTL